MTAVDRPANAVTFVQIAVTGVENNAGTQCNYVIVGLDAKGRIWEKPDGHCWYLIEPPTEPEIDDDRPF